tara:strand:+ start:4 stop:189 length:186 start_codon:yes stop_codon:yes gene_type:complete
MTENQEEKKDPKIKPGILAINKGVEIMLPRRKVPKVYLFNKTLKVTLFSKTFTFTIHIEEE